MKISCILAFALSTTALPALAESPQVLPAAAAVTKGAIIFSADGRRIGRVEQLRNGDAMIIYNGKFIHIPVSSLTAADRGFTTSLSRAGVNKL